MWIRKVIRCWSISVWQLKKRDNRWKDKRCKWRVIQSFFFGIYSETSNQKFFLQGEMSCMWTAQANTQYMISNVLSVRCTASQQTDRQAGGLTLHSMQRDGSTRHCSLLLTRCAWKICIWKSSLHLAAVKMQTHPTLTLEIYGPFLPIPLLWPALTCFRGCENTCDVTE